MNLPLSLGILAVAVAMLGIAVYLRGGRLRDGSRTAAAAVAAPSQTSVERMASIIERLGNVEADLKNLERKLTDADKSWERRWGTIARGMRKDAAAAAVDAEPTPDSGDEAQFDMLQATGSEQPRATAARPRLVPMHPARR